MRCVKKLYSKSYYAYIPYYIDICIYNNMRFRHLQTPVHLLLATFAK